MPDSRVHKHPEKKEIAGNITGGNPAPYSIHHPVINIGGLIDGLEQIPDTTPSVSPYPGAPPMQASSPTADLAEIRSAFPFISILPIPKVVTVVLTANVPADINVPSGTVMAMFKGTGDFWLSWSGTAQVPVAGADANSPAIGVSVYDPTNQLFYVANNRQLSALATGACIVQMLCWAYSPRAPRQRIL